MNINRPLVSQSTDNKDHVKNNEFTENIICYELSVHDIVLWHITSNLHLCKNVSQKCVYKETGYGFP